MNQPRFYHTVLLVHSILLSGQPIELFKMFDFTYQYSTRQAENGVIRPAGSKWPRLDISNRSFRWQAVRDYNLVPSYIKNLRVQQFCDYQETLGMDDMHTGNMELFKREVKLFTMDNVPFDCE